MTKFKYNMFEELEVPTIILSTKYHKHLGIIDNIDRKSINANFNMASAGELSFDVYKRMDGTVCSLWDSVVDFKYIYVPEYQEYYEIAVRIDEDNKTVKHITAASACEAELSTRKLRNFECNTEADILRDDYVKTVLYNSKNPNASLLNRVLRDKCPDYTIAHVDSSIASIQRTFSADEEDIYTFLTSTVAEEIECLFIFDSVNRTISVYDLKNVCQDCGYRGTETEACPVCGSHNIKNGYGENTAVYISADNYAESITIEGDQDKVVNCLRIEGGDDLMTATVANINPNGSVYIYHYPSELLDDMPVDLVEQLNSYRELYNSLKPVYEDYTEEIYQAVDEEAYLTSKMMPTVTAPVTSAKEELNNLILQIKEVAVANIAVISDTSADIAVKGMAKAILDARYDVSILSSSLSDLIEGTHRIWSGKLKITNKSDDEDTAESASNITIHMFSNNYEEYLYQKIQKSLNKEDALFYSIFQIKDLDTFKTELKKYCLDCLKSFESSYQTCIDLLIENGITDEHAVFYDVNLYDTMYLPYYQRILAIQAESVIREAEIKVIQERKLKYATLRDDIQNQLNFREYMGDDLWFILSHYLREDTYSNSNYISDGLDNGELIDKAKELFETANHEINHAGEIQLTLSSALNNLLNTTEFKNFKDKITLGNWINVKADDALYRLRLIGIGIDYGNLETISVTFSNVIKQHDMISDTASILKQAQTIAISYDYIAHQANKGTKAQENIQSWITDGLDSGLVRLKNNDHEEITYDEHGILARSYDDITESYSPEQLKLTSNILAFTKDNWLTCSAALGKHNYNYYDETENSFVTSEDYGLSAQFVQAGYIYGSQMIGGDIYSDNYSSSSGTHINLRDGHFSFAGGNLNYDGHDLSISGNITATEGKIGNFQIRNALYSGTSTVNSTVPGVYLGTDGIRQYGDEKHYIDMKNGILTANGAEINGTITAANLTAKSSGNIAGWEISEKALYSGPDSIDSSNTGTYLGTDGIKQTGNNNHNVTIKNGILSANNVNINGGHIGVSKNNSAAYLEDGKLCFSHGQDTSYMQAVNTSTGVSLELNSGSDIDIESKSGIQLHTTDSESTISFHHISSNHSYLMNSTWGGNITGGLMVDSQVVSSSDADQKNSISPLDASITSSFIYQLIPVQYKYNNGTSNRYHHGFIAQDVKAAMGKNDWGLYIDDAENGKGLRYEELIADMILTIQEQNKRISELERRIING